MMHRMRNLPFLLLALASSAVFAGTPILEPHLQEAKTGVVMDKDTGQPIAGAFIVERWFHNHLDPTAIGPAHAGEVGRSCMLQRQATTDAQGHFALPAVNDALKIVPTTTDRYEDRYQWGLLVYAKGYAGTETDRHQDDEHPAVAADGTLQPVRLVRATDTPSDRALNLAALPMKAECAGDASTPNLLATATREAYASACGKPDGWSAARTLADMRLRAADTLPPLNQPTLDELHAILQRNRINAPIGQDDAKRVCALVHRTLGDKP